MTATTTNPSALTSSSAATPDPAGTAVTPGPTGTGGAAGTGSVRSSLARARRIGYAVAGLAAIVATVIVAARGDGWAVTAAIVLAIAPDVPLFFGFGPGLGKGQLHPRAVPAYNAAHRLAGPAVVLVLAALTGSLTAGAAGLAWLAHVLVDRAAGYNLRTPDGWQR